METVFDQLSMVLHCWAAWSNLRRPAVRLSAVVAAVAVLVLACGVLFAPVSVGYWVAALVIWVVSLAVALWRLRNAVDSELLTA